MSLTDRYEHSGSAGPATLSADISPSSTSITISDGTGWPTGSVGMFWVTLGRGTANEERILCSSRTSNTLTVDTRGADGTVARSHSATTTVVEHTWSQSEADQTSAHTSSTSEHGVSGNVVGTSDTQTLTNKTITSPSIGGTVAGGATYTSPTLTTPAIASFVNAGHTHAAAASGGNIPESSVTNLVADLAAKASTSSVTTVANDLTTHEADNAAHNIGTPTITDFTNSLHTHANTSMGGPVILNYQIDNVHGSVSANNASPGPVTVNQNASLTTGVWLIIAEVSAVSTDGASSRHHFTLTSNTGSIYQQPKYNEWTGTGNSNGVTLVGLALAVGNTTITLSLTHDSGSGTVTVDANDCFILAIRVG